MADNRLSPAPPPAGVQTDTFTPPPVFTAASLTSAHGWEQPERPSADEQIIGTRSTARQNTVRHAGAQSC